MKNEPEKIVHRTNEGPASSKLKRGGVCFRSEPVNICTSRKEFFLNRVIPVWNELPKEIREARSLNCFKAGLDK